MSNVQAAQVNNITQGLHGVQATTVPEPEKIIRRQLRMPRQTWDDIKVHCIRMGLLPEQLVQKVFAAYFAEQGVEK